jgi:dipeptidyl aminopeptidase/acylaminoacyl peptidase
MKLAFLRFSLFIVMLLASQTRTLAQGPAKHAITFDDMIQMHRVGEAQVSPDGKWVAYTVSTPDLDANRGVSNIWIMPTAGGTSLQLTQSGHDSSPVWSPNGKMLAFLSSRSEAVDASFDGRGHREMVTGRKDDCVYIGSLSGLQRRCVQQRAGRRKRKRQSEGTRRGASSLPALDALERRQAQSFVCGPSG